MPGTSRTHDDRGSTSVQVVVLLPLLFVIVFTALQVGLYYYGRTTALSAATIGARAAATLNGTTADCEAAAAAFAVSVGDALTNTRVECTRNAATATAVVSGSCLSVLPGIPMTASQTAIVQVERLSR